MITPAIATCGSILTELGLGKDFKDVEIRDHACDNVIEKLLLFCWHTNCGIDQPFTHLKTITHSVRLALAMNQ